MTKTLEQALEAIVERATASGGNWYGDRAVEALASHRSRVEADREAIARDAIERLIYALRIAVAGKPLRDMAETIAEGERAILAMRPSPIGGGGQGSSVAESGGTASPKSDSDGGH